MKKIFIFTLISVISLYIVGCENSNIATVNGVEITKDEYEKTMNIIQVTSNYVGNEYTDESKNDLKNIIKSLMIDNEVVYQEGKNEGLEPNNEQVKIKYEELKKSINSNPYYKKEIENINIDKSYMIELLKKDMTIDNYRKVFQSNIEVNEEDILEYYNTHKDEFNTDEVKASQILISTLDKNNNEISEDDKGKQKEKAEEILNKIRSGEEFKILAKKYSDDKLSGKNGGDLGYFSKNDKNIEFTSKVFNLNENEVSEVFETSYGYHIVKLIEKRNSAKEYDECKDEIKENILNQKYINHIEKLNKEAKIK